MDNKDLEKEEVLEESKTKEEIEKIKDYYKNLEGMTCTEIFKMVINALKINISNVLILILGFIGVSIVQNLIATFMIENNKSAWLDLLSGEVQNIPQFFGREFLSSLLIILIMLIIEFVVIYIIASIIKSFMYDFYYNKEKSNINKAYSRVKDRIFKYFLADMMYMVISALSMFLIFFALLKMSSDNIFEFFGTMLMLIIVILIAYIYISLLFILRGELILFSKRNIIESFKISKKLVKGHKFDIFIMQIFILIGGFVTNKLIENLFKNTNQNYINEIGSIKSFLISIPEIAVSNTMTIILHMLIFGVISIKFFNILDIKGKNIDLEEKAQ
ncbi:DUF975 family protein [Peptostreptococcaceae bacterium AGR-M142]